MEFLLVFIVIFIIYGAGWIWQTVADIIRDARRLTWDNRVYGQVASSRTVRKQLQPQHLEALRKSFKRIASIRDGELHDRAPFESPKVSFVYKASRALLSLYETRQSPVQFYTQLSFTLPPGYGRRLELFPATADRSTRMRNVEDVEIGHRGFDERYVVVTDEVSFAEKVLDHPRRELVEELRLLPGREDLLISLNASRLLIRKHSALFSAPELDRFVTLSCALFERIFELWQAESGIEILEDDTPAEPASPVCQVCGAKLGDAPVVYCKRCRTPHHKECWDYNGACSTYACGEKRSVRRY